MLEKAKLEIVMDENGIHTEIKGKPEDMMFLAHTALQETKNALEKCPKLSKEDVLSLMDEVIESFQVEAYCGKEIADIRAMMKLIKHL